MRLIACDKGMSILSFSTTTNFRSISATSIFDDDQQTTLVLGRGVEESCKVLSRAFTISSNKISFCVPTESAPFNSKEQASSIRREIVPDKSHESLVYQYLDQSHGQDQSTPRDSTGNDTNMCETAFPTPESSDLPLCEDEVKTSIPEKPKETVSVFDRLWLGIEMPEEHRMWYVEEFEIPLHEYPFAEWIECEEFKIRRMVPGPQSE